MWSGRHARERKKKKTNKQEKGKGKPDGCPQTLWDKRTGFVGREGRLTEAYEPIPVRLRAHLHLGEERARGMGFVVCIITREANVLLSSESVPLMTNIDTTLS